MEADDEDTRGTSNEGRVPAPHHAVKRSSRFNRLFRNPKEAPVPDAVQHAQEAKSQVPTDAQAPKGHTDDSSSPGEIGTVPDPRPQAHRLVDQASESDKVPALLGSNEPTYPSSGQDEIFPLPWPDTVADVRFADALCFYVASRVGPKNSSEGRSREDAYCLVVKDKAAALAISDGVGSSVHAHLAASLASSVACSLGLKWAESGHTSWCEHAAHTARSASGVLRSDELIAHAARSIQCPPHDGRLPPPATTLAAVVVTSPSKGPIAWWFTVGDSKILRLDLSLGRWSWLSGFPDLISTNVTDALPADSPSILSGREAIRRNDALVVATDGAWRAIAEYPDEFAKSISRLAEARLSAAKYATLLDFSAPGHGDDRTLAVITLSPTKG